MAIVHDAPMKTGQVPINALKGFCMGSADVVPGVSGGTMALILGIYERLLNAIHSFDRNWLRDLLTLKFSSALARNDLVFLLPLALGIALAIIFFTRVIPLPRLIVTHPEIIYGLFFGLISASVVVLMKEVDNYRAVDLLTTLLGVALGFAIVNLVPLETPSSAWFIFLCGFIAISAMLLPGISGSFILLILGKYAYVIDAIGRFDLWVMFAFGAGAITGLVVFSRAIVWLLRRYHRSTLLVIKGILIGSLWIIWPFQERVYVTVRGKSKLMESAPFWPGSFDSTVLAAMGMMVTGFVLVLVIAWVAGRQRNST
jgi:putative membrane protein